MTDRTTTSTIRRGPHPRRQDRPAARDASRPATATRRARSARLAATLCTLAAGAAVVLADAAPSSAATAPAVVKKYSATAPGSSRDAALTARAVVRPNTIVLGNCGETYEFTVVTNIRSGAGTWNSIVGTGRPGQWFDAKYETSYSYSGYRWVWGVDLDTDVGGWVAVQLLRDLGPSGCTVLN